jgi:prephenate dehydrogenase
MIRFANITVIGTGLIGGSLSLAFKRKVPGVTVTGVDLPAVLDEAIEAGVIDRGVPVSETPAAVGSADLVFLCTPIREILRLLPEIALHAKPGTVVTDVGSTKRLIVETADRHFLGDRFFIGGHPMAGGEGRGPRMADALLFENAVYVFTPSRPLPPDIMKELGNTIERIGAKILLLSPAMHDRVAAAVSHLPQMLAITLMNMVAAHQEDSPYFVKLAAGGFRDMTRIASSPYDMWESVIETNRPEILSFMDEFIRALEEMKRHMTGGSLKKQFQDSARHRLSIPKDTKGFLKPHHDMLVRVEDRPGVIASISGALAAEGINIKDIEILKVREGEAGTLRLSFESPEARQAAKAALEKTGHSCRHMGQ